jgi:beta-galactosidase GanA
MELISQIASIRDAATFVAYSAKTDAPSISPFQARNLIYGFNGCGKTTLSTIFDYLGKGARPFGLAEKCEFEVVLSDGTVIGHDRDIEKLKDRVCVYNQDFIASNFNWQDGTARPVQLGGGQIEDVKKLEELEGVATALRNAISPITEIRSSAKRALETFCTAAAREIEANARLPRRSFQADVLRRHHVRLVLLWFGTWKNTGPAYAPAGVKLDNARFPRMIDQAGKNHYALSPHYQATLDADRKAFSTFLSHLKAVDAQRTVIMVQVENEPGTYRLVRDYSPVAQKLFDGPVPGKLVTGLHKMPGTWKQVFGKDADEFFHAWSIASYIEQVAKAGKAVYPLPMYANAALRDPYKDQDPHTYAAGGPTWNVLDIWKIAAPSLFAAAPDIYGQTYQDVSGQISRYARPDNPLLIVEIGNSQPFARYLFAALGNHAIGYAPFGMDFSGYSNYPLGAKALTPEVIAPFAAEYGKLAPMAREWAKLSFESKVWGVSEPDDHKTQAIDLGRWTATVEYQLWPFGMSSWTWLKKLGPPPGTEKPGGGVVIAQLGPDEFLVIGLHARVSFSLTDKKSSLQPQFDRVEEGHYAQGKWVFDRVWNGDQTDYGLNFTESPQVLRVKMATY